MHGLSEMDAAASSLESSNDTCIIDNATEEEWTSFVYTAPQATFFHDWRWGDVAERIYGHAPLRLAAKRNGKLVGVLPLTDVKSPFFGRSLISTAFTVGGGVAARDAAAAKALSIAAIEAGRSRNVQYIELRSEAALFDDWRTKDQIYAAFSKTMPTEEDARLAAIPRKRRAEVRKALKFEAEGRLSIRFDDDIDCFYDIYARSVRDLGTPVFSRKYAAMLKSVFGEAVEIAIVEGDGTPIAALVSFYFRDRIMPYYVGAAGEARVLRAFDFLYWKVMSRACEKGAPVFDFGRSKVGTPHHDYKKLWGFEATPLAYQYAMVKARDVPDVNPNNPKFKMVSAAWKRLPVPIANRVGPILAGNLA